MGIMTGSPNIMKVNTEGVFKCLKDMIPTLLDLGQRSLHHVMKAGVKEMPRAVDFANDVYYYTHRTDYKETQNDRKTPTT